MSIAVTDVNLLLPILLNGSVTALTSSPTGGVLTATFDRRDAVQSLGTVVPGRPYPVTVQGNLTAGGVFTAQGEVVIALNHAPVAVNDAYTTAEDTLLTVTAPGVLTNDTDVDVGTTLTASLMAGPLYGMLTLNADGSFTYTPAAGYVGPDSFTYKVNDGQAYSNVATVSITVTQVTRAVTFVAGAGGTLTGTTSQTVNLYGSTAPVTAEPNPGYHFVNWTGAGGFSSTSNPLTVSNVTADLTITANFVNSPPTANPQSVTVSQNGSVGITLSGTDPESSPLTYAIVASPAHGNLTGTAPNVTYAPTAGYVDGDSFTFTVSDGTNTSPPATVSITVNALTPPAGVVVSVTGVGQATVTWNAMLGDPNLAGYKVYWGTSSGAYTQQRGCRNRHDENDRSAPAGDGVRGGVVLRHVRVREWRVGSAVVRDVVGVGGGQRRGRDCGHCGQMPDGVQPGPEGQRRGRCGGRVRQLPEGGQPRVASWTDYLGVVHTNSQPDFDLNGLGAACDVGGSTLALTVPTGGAPGAPLWADATFMNNTGGDLTTIRPDCFNTFFAVTDAGGNLLPLLDRVRAPYGIPADVVTIANGTSFAVTCDLSEMYPDLSSSAQVVATYGNSIQDPDRNPATGSCSSPPCYDLFMGCDPLGSRGADGLRGTGGAGDGGGGVQPLRVGSGVGAFLRVGVGGGEQHRG